MTIITLHGEINLKKIEIKSYGLDQFFIPYIIRHRPSVRGVRSLVCTHIHTMIKRNEFFVNSGVRVGANSLQGSNPQKHTPYRIWNAECVLFDNRCVHHGWSPKIWDQVIRRHRLSDESRRWPPLDDLNEFYLQWLIRKINYVNHSASVLLGIEILGFAIFAKHGMCLYYSALTRRPQRPRSDLVECKICNPRAQ